MKKLVQKLVIKIVFFTIIIFSHHILRGQYCVLIFNKNNKNIEFSVLSKNKSDDKLFTLKICDSILLKKRNDEIKIDSLILANSKQNEKIAVKDSYTDACLKLVLKQVKTLPNNKKYFIYSLDNFWSYFTKHVNEKFYFVIIEYNEIKYYEGELLFPEMT